MAQSGPRTLTLMVKRGDKLIERDAWDFAPDGRSVHITSTNVPSDRTVSMTALKQ